METPKIIVTIAPTGGMASKQQNPHLPTQPEEIARDTYDCFNAGAGASVVAVHARRPDGGATCDPAIYRDINERIRGGHARTGLEDNMYYAHGELATNVRLMERLVRIIRDPGMEPATPAEARAIMGLPRRQQAEAGRTNVV